MKNWAVAVLTAILLSSTIQSGFAENSAQATPVVEEDNTESVEHHPWIPSVITQGDVPCRYEDPVEGTKIWGMLAEGTFVHQIEGIADANGQLVRLADGSSCMVEPQYLLVASDDQGVVDEVEADANVHVESAPTSTQPDDTTSEHPERAPVAVEPTEGPTTAATPHDRGTKEPGMITVLPLTGHGLMSTEVDPTRPELSGVTDDQRGGLLILALIFAISIPAGIWLMNRKVHRD